MQTRHLNAHDVARLLAATLGEEKSAEVVRAAMDKLGIEDAALEQSQVDAILEHLARSQGIVGLAARFAKQRSRISVKTLPPPARHEQQQQQERQQQQSQGTPAVPHAAPAPSPAPGAPAASSARERVDVRLLVELFVPTLGEEKSDDVVHAALRQLQYDPDALGREQALLVLEALAVVPGIVGVTARFAKARFVLRFA